MKPYARASATFLSHSRPACLTDPPSRRARLLYIKISTPAEGWGGLHVRALSRASTFFRIINFLLGTAAARGRRVRKGKPYNASLRPPPSARWPRSHISRRWRARVCDFARGKQTDARERVGMGDTRSPPHIRNTRRGGKSSARMGNYSHAFHFSRRLCVCVFLAILYCPIFFLICN